MDVPEHLRAKTLVTLEVNGYLLNTNPRENLLPLPTHTTTEDDNPRVAEVVHHADNTPYTTDSLGVLLAAAELVDSQVRQRRSPSAGSSTVRRPPSADPSMTRRSPSAGPSTIQRPPSAGLSTKPDKKYIALAPQYKRALALSGARQNFMAKNPELYSQVYAKHSASHQHNRESVVQIRDRYLRT